MPIFGALLGGALSLFGAKKAADREDANIAAQNEYNDPANIRKRAEDAGFNPSLWAGTGNIQTSTSNSGALMGNGMANFGLAIQDGFNQEAQRKYEQQKLELENKKLQALIVKNTLRPKVGGVYAQTVKTPSIKKTGAPLMVGVPAEKPSIMGDPTTVYRDDGLQAANPENPAELEADLWDQARQGTIVPFGWEIYKRNTMSPWQRQNWEGIKKSTKQAVTGMSNDVKDVFMRPRKSNAKIPKVDFPSYLPSISN